MTIAATAPARFDVGRIRADFPILRRKVRGRPLVYLDNAATTQKPQAVVDAVSRYYTEINANVHRGVHELSELATDAYEGAREKVRRFLNARTAREIVFTRNATESINLVAHAFGGLHVRRGDEVVISAMEHHSNIVPWQMLCSRTGARLRVAPIDDSGELLRRSSTIAPGSLPSATCRTRSARSILSRRSSRLRGSTAPACW
jgi:cysteine desulfurase/selenocysteine lyase